ncbi:hypothetical protein RHRU231_470133 [Rhodococcus ruber]|uniref:Uncharacterized protein n=1 Tax=Rhodococcus ruber TaxID=1830 RepID=A0A098BM34_9NOCA|nr:hypothetical protein RHRU231_470133 [Rhodococcus ruber]
MTATAGPIAAPPPSRRAGWRRTRASAARCRRSRDGRPPAAVPRGAGRRAPSRRDRLEAGGEVGEDVVDVFDADGEADLAGGDAGGELFGGGELGVGGRGGVDDQRAHVADVGDVAVQGQRVHELLAGVDAAGEFEGDDRAGPARGQGPAALVPGGGVEAGVGDGGDLGAAGEEVGDPAGVGDVAFHAQAQGLEALGDEEGVERGDRGAEVAQQLHAGLEGVGGGAEVGVDHAVVAGVGGGELGVAGGAVGSGGGPVEGAAVDDDPGDGGAVAAEVFGGRVHDDVGAVLEGADQVGGGDGVVDDQRQGVLVGDGGDAGDVEEVVFGVGDGFAVEGAGGGADGGAPLVEVVGVVDEGDLDAEAGQGVVQQVVGAAVEVGAGDEVVAGGGEVEDGVGLGGLAGGEEQGGDAALEGGDALFDRVLGGVHDAGVDVAGFGEAEQGGGVVGVVEGVAGGLVDRQGAGAGVAAGGLSCVDLLGLEAPAVFAPGVLAVGHDVLTGRGREVGAASDDSS